MNKLFNVLGIILTIILVPSCEKKPIPPSLSTTTVTEISTTTAVSGGSITADGGSPVISRGVCWNTSDDPTIENNKTMENGDLLSFTSNITQLSPNTSYYVRAYATNSAGTGYGKSVPFKTHGDKPASNVLNTSNITINSATLNGSINPNFLSTTVTFEYGVSTSYGSTATAQESPVSGDTDGNVTVKADLSGLTPGTTYHFRIKAENSLGITYSSDLPFTTLGQAPIAITEAVTNLLVRTATLNGSVNPNYLSTIVTFEWGTSTSYGNTITPTQSPVNGSTSVSVSAGLTGLAPGTTYHFRIVATNELGTTNGNDLTFTTLGKIPTAVTQTTTNLKVNTVTLNGSVNPNYLSSTVSFEWGTTTEYGNTLTALQSPLTGSTLVNISADLSELTPETTYHFRISATNELGTTNGEDLTFKTFAAIDADGNGYYSVNIGTQTWLTENIRTTKFSNGDLIGTTDPATKDISNESTPNYQWAPNGIESNVPIYGRLYSWYAVIDGRHICPTGWHVPSDAEWTTLADYLINNGYGIGGSGNGIAKSMAAITGWTTVSEEGSIGNDPSNNSSGFTALPAGYRFSSNTFTNIGYVCTWWSSTEDQTSTAWYRELYYSVSSINTVITNKNVSAFSVRCIK
ncbi:MAG: hypothetical protein LLG13_13945 [Bacteroidales bacterium]|nr:hypothetical protein [Bacteroidales bacterium]